MNDKKARVAELLQKKNLDCIMVSGKDNILYLTQIPVTDMAANPVLDVLQQFNPSILLIGSDGRHVLFAATSLAQFIEENILDLEVYYYPTVLFIDYRPGIKKPKTYGCTVTDCLVRYLRENRLFHGRIGIDAQFYTNPGTELLENRADIVNVENDLYFLRRIKTNQELSHMIHAARAGYAGMKWVQDAVEAGADVTEADLFYGLRKILLEHQCQWKFTTVACGRYSADVYHQPLDTYRLKPEDVVRMDIGAVYRGYGSDIACTCFGPKAPQAYKDLYQVLCDGQRIIIDGLKPGAKGKELFHKGQEYVRQHGYPQYTRSMLGHSISIQTEEYPFISPTDEMVVEEGMILCIELPFYIKDLAGLNIEHMVRVEKEGAVPLFPGQF